MKTVRFAFIGCGKIAHCHADVIKHLGHTIEAVIARPGSVNIDAFAEKYAVGKKIYGIEGFLKYWGESDNATDCILVSTPWDVTESVLKQLLSLGVPLMSEKPAVLSLVGLRHLKEKYETKNQIPSRTAMIFKFLFQYRFRSFTFPSLSVLTRIFHKDFLPMLQAFRYAEESGFTC